MTLALSTGLQYFAAFLAIRLIAKTRHVMAWALISAACLLMAVRRTISLVAIWSDGYTATTAPVVEGVALGISILMVLGIWKIGGLFEEMTRSSAERRALRERLLESQRLESLSVLSGGLAHDFNNILTCVLGHAEALRDQLGVKHSADRPLLGIVKAVERASDLTSRLLAYSGRGRFEVCLVDLNRKVAEIDLLLRGSLGGRCKLTTALAEGQQGIKGDRAQIQQVLMSVITNAIEAVGEGPGTVRVSTSRVDERDPGLTEAFARFDHGVTEDAYVRLRVEDDGPGMGEETLAKIYDPFFSTKAPGRGLGLAAVLGIVNGHNGAILTRSSANQGTCVDIWIPATAEFEDPDISSADFIEPVGVGEATVLVVDDESDVRATIRNLLEIQGFRVIDVASGEQAIAMVSDPAFRVDIAVVDLTMPGMDGGETIERLRLLRPVLPSILISGFDDRDARVPSLPGVRFLHKPFRQRDLRDVIQSLLSGAVAEPTMSPVAEPTMSSTAD